MAQYVRVIIDATTQSWGSYAPRNVRPTLNHPSRSGVVGTVGNALGLDRSQTTELDNLHHHLRVSSRVLRRGRILRDYHNKNVCPTAKEGGEPWDKQVAKGGKNVLKAAHNRRKALLAPASSGNKTSERYYLNEWAFQVVIEVLPGCYVSAEEIIAALDNPARGLHCGRKSCIPLRPLVESDSQPFEADTPMDAFCTVEPLANMDYPLGDPSGALLAHLDVTGDISVPGCQVVPEIIYDACRSVNGRVFDPRQVLHITRTKKEG